MYWFWIMLGIVLPGSLGYAFVVWQTVHRSIEASAPLIEKAVAYEQHPKNPNMRILVAGDSTGVGVGVATSTESIAGRIGRDFPDADITNISHSGDKLSDLEGRLMAHAGKTYDIVLLQIGANDITGRTSFERVEVNLNASLAQARPLGKKVVVMTAGDVGLSPAFMWPLSQFFDYSTRRVRYIFMAQVAHSGNTSYVDLFREAKDEPFNTDIGRYYAADRFHPSGDGYALWYAELKPLL